MLLSCHQLLLNITSTSSFFTVHIFLSADVVQEDNPFLSLGGLFYLLSTTRTQSI